MDIMQYVDPAWIFIKEVCNWLLNSGLPINTASFVLGVICCPLLLFIRARRDTHWDNSNMTNMYRLIAHVAAHPSDFAYMQYSDGRKPFWYIKCDELSDVVNVRPPELKKDK